MDFEAYNKISRNELSPEVNQAIDAGYSRAEQAEQNSKQYTDDQIGSIMETGVPKLAKYLFEIENTEPNLTVFEIPLDVFSKEFDFVEVFVNSTFKAPTEYTVTNSTETDRGYITFNEGINDAVVIIIVSRNEPMGEEGAVNGSVIASGTIDDSRLSDSPNSVKQKLNNHINESAPHADHLKKSGDSMTGDLGFSSNLSIRKSATSLYSSTRYLVEYNNLSNNCHFLKLAIVGTNDTAGGNKHYYGEYVIKKAYGQMSWDVSHLCGDDLWDVTLSDIVHTSFIVNIQGNHDGGHNRDRVTFLWKTFASTITSAED